MPICARRSRPWSNWKPITLFHEPINIRAENVARIEAQAKSVGVQLRTEVFAARESWQDYAVNALRTVSELARELGIRRTPDSGYRIRGRNGHIDVQTSVLRGVECGQPLRWNPPR